MRKLYFSILMFQILAPPSFAGTLPKEAKFRCSKQLETLLSKWSTKPPEWIKQRIDEANESWVSPTETIGAFMTIGNSGKSVVATKTTDLTSITAVLVSPECRSSLTVSYVKEAPQKVSTSTFTNTELASLLKTGESGIVFAFSEGMYHSVQSLETIKKVAQKQNLKLTILRDPEFRTKNYGTVSKLASTELILRGMTIHYPSVMVYSKGELKGQALVGRKTEDQYVQWVKKVIQ